MTYYHFQMEQINDVFASKLFCNPPVKVVKAQAVTEIVTGGMVLTEYHDCWL